MLCITRKDPAFPQMSSRMGCLPLVFCSLCVPLLLSSTLDSLLCFAIMPYSGIAQMPSQSHSVVNGVPAEALIIRSSAQKARINGGPKGGCRCASERRLQYSLFGDSVVVELGMLNGGRARKSSFCKSLPLFEYHLPFPSGPTNCSSGGRRMILLWRLTGTPHSR